MKISFLIVAIAVCVLIVACGKDKYNTTPQLEFKSVNGSSFPNGSLVSFKFNVTDKEGDILDTMWIQKFSIICPDSDTEVPTPYLLPNFTTTKHLKVELDVNYGYGAGNSIYVPLDRSLCASNQQRNDSIYFRFWMKDEAGNVSDTVTTDPITLLK